MVSNQNLKSFNLSKELKVNYGLIYQHISTPKIHQPQEKIIRDKNFI